MKQDLHGLLHGRVSLSGMKLRCVTFFFTINLVYMLYTSRYHLVLYRIVSTLQSWAFPCRLMNSQVFMIYMKTWRKMNTQKTTYVIQFLWRDLSSKFDIIGPYFTIPSTMEAKFLHGIVVRTMLAFTQFGFGVRALLSDGASANLSLMKILCGHEDASTMAISPWFTSPYDGKKVYLIVCPSHQVRCLPA